MDDTKLRNLSILCSVLGIALLFYASSALTGQAVEINSITGNSIGTAAKVCGVVESQRVSKGHVFLEVADSSGSITAVAFNTTASALKLQGVDIYSAKKGSSICVYGEVSEYPKGSGKLELLVSRVEL